MRRNKLSVAFLRNRISSYIILRCECLNFFKPNIYISVFKHPLNIYRSSVTPVSCVSRGQYTVTFHSNSSGGAGLPKLRGRPPEGGPRDGQEHLPDFAEVKCLAACGRSRCRLSPEFLSPRKG